MLTMKHFINGNTVDNEAIMRQWQLTDEANWLTMQLEQMDFFPSEFKKLQADIVHQKALARLDRRLTVMHQLIEEWNKATEIYEQHGREIIAAIEAAL